MSIVMVSGSEGWAGVNDGGTICGNRYCSDILHYTGGLWSDWRSPVLDARSMAMVSANEGWAVGGAGAIWRYDGTTWSAVATPTHQDLYTVAMISASEGWAGGGHCRIYRDCSRVLLHYMNGTWRVYESS